MLRSWWRIGLVLLLLLISQHEAQARDLIVGVPVSLTEVMRTVARAFEAKHGTRVKLSLGASSMLVQQALHGAHFDAIVTADEDTMERLEQAGRLKSGSRQAMIGNLLAMIVPKSSSAPGGKETFGQSKDLAALLKPEFTRIVICDQQVPAGRYAAALLRRLGLYTELRPKLVAATNVRAALALVASGAVDAGFVYTTDIAAARDRVGLVREFGAGDGVDVRYEAAVLDYTESPTAALHWVEFLRSPEAQKVFERAGFRRI